MSQTLDAKAVHSAASAGLGELELAGGHHEIAERRYRQGIVTGWEGGYPPGVALNVQGLLRLLESRGEAWRAARLAGALEVYGSAKCLLPPATFALYESAVERLRRVLEHETFLSAASQGRALALPDLVAEAL